MALSARADDAFQRGCAAYDRGNYELAAQTFSALAQIQPSANAFRNLGNAEWRCGRIGEAVRAWERAQWLASFDVRARNNLHFARHVAQLGVPELAWYEVASTWLPVDVWPWLAALSFWGAAAVLLLPGVFGWPRREWHQALAAVAIAVFLLTLPALAGVQSRSRLGVIVGPGAALRLTPTREAQTVMKLPPGEIARQVRTRGDYVFVRAGSDASGWVRREEFGPISAP